METKTLLILPFIAIAIQGGAQINVGSNTAPNTDAMLEISGSTKGLLLPRVALTSTSAPAPLSAHIEGMSVYNTATAGTGTTAVTPGFYYNTGTAWLKMVTGNGSSWFLNGNTNGSVKSIGTLDNYDLPFTTNAIEKMRILNTGEVGIGTTSPAAKLDVAAGITLVNSVVNATGNINDYLQYNVQNTSAGTHAQSGYSATADNGSATTGFAWVGINNSTFNYPTAYNIGGANDVSLLGSGQDLHLANANNTKSIIFSTGKAASPFFNERMRITNAGNVGIGTTTPTRLLEVQGSTSTNNIPVIYGYNNRTSGFNYGIYGTYNGSSYGIGVVGMGYSSIVPPSATEDIGIYGSAATYGVYSNGPLKAGSSAVNGQVIVSNLESSGIADIFTNSNTALRISNSGSGSTGASLQLKSSADNYLFSLEGRGGFRYFSRVSGVEKFKVDDNGSITTALNGIFSGKVGVGIATPVAKVDVAAGVTTTNTVINATGSINDYLQFNVQNTSAGIQAQSGYSATADNGSATTGFAWVGINNSAFNYPTTYNVGAANDVSLLGSGQDLYIANSNNTKSIIFSTGKASSPFFNERMRITNTGNVGIGTTTPTALLNLNDGHLRSQQTTLPTIAVTTANAITASAIAVNSSDMKGTITTTGTNNGTNTVLTITFNGSYTVAPTVIITPANANGQNCNYFVTSTTTTCVVTFNGGAANPSFNYIIIE